MNTNSPLKKRTLALTLNVIENRDSSFGNSKEVALSGCCTTTTCCFHIGGGGGSTGGGGGAEKQ